MRKAPPPAFVERRSTDLLGAAQRALRPLIRLLLQRGITFPVLSEALKRVFFRVARDELPLGVKKDTDSRLSILTGIHRRDIKRLRDELAAAEAPALPKSDVARRDPLEISLSARVLSVWTGTAEYLDETGRPKPLHRFARHGGEQSFEALVRQVNRDVRPRALLDEWLRRGAVVLDEQNRVCMNLDAFMAHRSLDEKSHYFAQNIHDHLAAIAHNVTGVEPPYLERCVYYGSLAADSVIELENLAREEGMKALQVVNRRALELKRRDAGNPAARERMNFGIYFYRTENELPPAPPDESKDGSRDE